MPIKLMLNDVEHYRLDVSPAKEEEFFAMLLEGMDDGDIVAVNDAAQRATAIRRTEQAQREAALTEPSDPGPEEPPAPSIPRRHGDEQ